jgi:hypothetical protein
MGALGRCVYFGELCAVLSTLAARGLWSQQDALSTLQGQGLDERTCLDMWGAAVAVGRD